MENLFKKTGTNNEEELATYIDELKKEKTAAKGAATKANNAVEDLTSKGLELTKRVSNLEIDKEELNETISELQAQIETERHVFTTVSDASENLKSKMAELTEKTKGLEIENKELVKDIEELEAKLQKQEKSTTTDKKKVKEKALAVMKQTGVDKVFVSEDGNVFLNENKAKNHSKGRYKVVTMLEGGKVKIR